MVDLMTIAHTNSVSFERRQLTLVDSMLSYVIYESWIYRLVMSWIYISISAPAYKLDTTLH